MKLLAIPYGRRAVQQSHGQALFSLRIVVRVFAVEFGSAGAVGHDAEHVIFAQRLNGARDVIGTTSYDGRAKAGV